MAKENHIREELLKEMDVKSDVNSKSIQEIIRRDQVHTRWMKWITVLSWASVIVCFLGKQISQQQYVIHCLNEGEYWVVSRSGTGLLISIVIAVLLTALLYTRMRTLTIRQILMRLAHIEALVRKMAEDR
jgi:uncharacterized membrane protein YciS (DUF1049 family)